jgi:transcriptional regulator with XRE-family HTH domain
MDYYALSASVFSDKIGVQRSGISHILSGRNKPSLDFILKIIEEFEEVNLYWLLYGQGSFPPAKESLPKNTVIEATETKISEEVPIQKKSFLKNIKKENTRIVKIIILYENGNFDSFEN